MVSESISWWYLEYFQLLQVQNGLKFNLFLNYELIKRQKEQNSFDWLKSHFSLAIQMHIPSVQIFYPKMDMNVLILPLTKKKRKKKGGGGG